MLKLMILKYTLDKIRIAFNNILKAIKLLQNYDKNIYVSKITAK
jgi:hypothetical protein